MTRQARVVQTLRAFLRLAKSSRNEVTQLVNGPNSEHSQKLGQFDRECVERSMSSVQALTVHGDGVTTLTANPWLLVYIALELGDGEFMFGDDVVQDVAD